MPKIIVSTDILPPPFAWIDIPSGKVTLLRKHAKGRSDIGKKGERTFDVPAFAIAKYPLTNAQFTKFIESSGYNNRQWWTEAGWKVREQGIAWDSKSRSWKPTGKAWTEPRYWQDSEWNPSDRPVVGVSWFEAVAFCLWLSDLTSEKIMLPTEDQWQYAAQGDDDRAYPWGNEWDGTRCNNSVSPYVSDVTTAVRQYEGKGDSPFGVVDMAGNVSEWCLTAYENEMNDINSEASYRVLHGGSWGGFDEVVFRADIASRYAPGGRNHLFGFRPARSLRNP